MLNENSLYEASVLITDRSGIAFEYTFGTERPVTFIDTPFKIRNKNWEQLQIEPIELQLRNKIGVFLKLKGLDQVIPRIKDFLKNTELWKKC